MTDPFLLKSVGFVTTLVGLGGNIAVLFLPKRLAKRERTIRIVFIVLMSIGVVGGKMATT
jgi:hypothetical protein